MRVLNIQLWDSCIAYDNFSFNGNQRAVNPRDPLSKADESAGVNYDLDSEDELQELLGEGMDSDWDSEDSEARELQRDMLMDGKGNDLELINAGFIVPDDYFSDSDDQSSFCPRDGENEAEFELRRQQKQIEREQKRQRHVFQKRLEERMKAVFKLGGQMKPTIELEGNNPMTEYKAVSLLQSFSALSVVCFPLPMTKGAFN